MALINCPECGRKNVSSHAVTCPICGFPIKQYLTNGTPQSKGPDATANNTPAYYLNKNKKTKKILFTFLLVPVLLVATILLYDLYQYIINGNEYYLEIANKNISYSDAAAFETQALSNGTVEITKYTGNEKKVVVPKYINGKKVTSIGKKAFYACMDPTSIILPEGLTSIGDSAFYYCNSLTSITLPKSLTSIGGWAFFSCDSLTNITLPEGMTSIGNNAFAYCDNLISVVLPKSLTSIGSNPFVGCSELTAINVSKNHPLLEVVNGSLINKKEKTLICYPCGCAKNSYTVPEGVEEIGASAFSHNSLINITLPYGLKYISYDAFSYCNNLNNIMIPDTVTYIGTHAFSNCTGLISITLSASITSFGSNVFESCPNLSTITVIKDSYVHRCCIDEGYKDKLVFAY